MSPVQQGRSLFTRDDFDRLPEGFPAQLVAGCLLKDAPPTPGHQWVAMRVARTLIPLIGEARVLLAPCGVAIDEHNVFSPDVVALRDPPKWDERYVGIPVAAFEVLSPSTERRDRRQKTPRMLEAGAEEVWLLDPVQEVIERHTREAVEVAADDERVASRAIPRFELTPARLFARPV